MGKSEGVRHPREYGGRSSYLGRGFPNRLRTMVLELDMAPEDVLPPGLVPRGLTRERAAAFVGLSPAAFDKARSEGKYPGPTLPGGRYDLVLLQASMDRLSGLITEGEARNPLDAWRDTRRAR
jgi:hypothetical protein